MLKRPVGASVDWWTSLQLYYVHGLGIERKFIIYCYFESLCNKEYHRQELGMSASVSTPKYFTLSPI